jgi:hypothetical protein
MKNTVPEAATNLLLRSTVGIPHLLAVDQPTTTARGSPLHPSQMGFSAFS